MAVPEPPPPPPPLPPTILQSPVTPTQIQGAPPTAPSRPLPPEIQEASRNPSKRVGPYVLAGPLGAGGMGVVVRAYDTVLHRWVALKFMRSAGDATARSYFEREAQLAAGLAHPNIASIYEIGTHEGQPYIAMQYVEGETLSAARGKMGLPRILEAVRRVCEAVKYAHGKSIIHRDLKPANVMVDTEGRVYVMDFGLAKERAIGADGQSLGGSGAVVGTPQYMAPEQAKGRAGPQSDVYGVGAILYELVTGRPPFVGLSTTDILLQVVNREPVWPRKLSPRTPADVEAIILHALEKDPKRRYASAESLLEDLEACAAGQPLRHARRPTLSYVLGKKIRRSPVLWAAGTAMALAVAGGAVFGVTQLFRAKSEAELRLKNERDAKRRESGLQTLATLWLGIVERKQELRNARAPGARAELERLLGEVDGYVREWPRHPQGYYVRARARTYLGDVDGAETDLRRALDVEPSFRPAWTLLGMIDVERHEDALTSRYAVTWEARMDRASPFLERALDAFARGWQAGREEAEAKKWGLGWSREDRVATRLAEVLRLRFGDRDDAAAEKALKDALEEYRSEEYLSQAGALARRVEDNIAFQTQAIETAPGYARAYRYRGDSKRNLKDYAGAILDYDRAIALESRRPAAFLNRGFARLRSGDLAEAIEDFDRAIALKADYGLAFFNRGMTRSLRADAAGALEDLDRAILHEKDFPPAYKERGRIRLGLGDPEGALADADRALAFEEISGAHLLRGIVLLRRGDLPGARKALDRAIELDPAAVEARVNRGFIQAAEGDLKGAIADYDRAIKLDDHSQEAYFNRGIARKAAGDLAGALADYDRAIELKKDFQKAYVNRGVLRGERGELAEALRDYDAALALDPRDVIAWVNRGQTRLAAGDAKGGAADLGKALELAPRDWPHRRHVEELRKQAGE